MSIINRPVACKGNNFNDSINYGLHHIRTTHEAGLLCTKVYGNTAIAVFLTLVSIVSLTFDPFKQVIDEVRKIFSSHFSVRSVVMRPSATKIQAFVRLITAYW